jgi:hypothetical protein
MVVQLFKITVNSPLPGKSLNENASRWHQSGTTSCTAP